MLAVFHGNDTVAVRERARAFAESRAVDPSSITALESDTLTPQGLMDSAEGVSLFGDSHVYILDVGTAKAAERDALEESLDVLAASVHVFVIIEGKILAAARKAYEKLAEIVEEYSATGGRTFNAFLMGDARASRDKKKLWLLLHDAFLEGLSSEEIIGTLWWQLKTMRLAAVTASAAEASMKDFPYSKAKRSLKNFKDGEIERISASLLAAYHDARLGKLELDLALEQWVLSL